MNTKTKTDTEPPKNNRRYKSTTLERTAAYVTGALNALYWRQNFVLDCVVVNTQKLLSSHGGMNKANHTSYHMDSGVTLILQETRSIHESMNIPNIEFIAHIYILL